MAAISAVSSKARFEWLKPTVRASMGARVARVAAEVEMAKRVAARMVVTV